MKAMLIVSALLVGSFAMAEGTAATAPAAAPAMKMSKSDAKKACQEEAKAAGKKVKGKELVNCINEKTK
jgi:hypothetical protein